MVVNYKTRSNVPSSATAATRRAAVRCDPISVFRVLHEPHPRSCNQLRETTVSIGVEMKCHARRHDVLRCLTVILRRPAADLAGESAGSRSQVLHSKCPCSINTTASSVIARVKRVKKTHKAHPGFCAIAAAERQRTGALQDASRGTWDALIRDSVLDCGSPLPLSMHKK